MRRALAGLLALAACGGGEPHVAPVRARPPREAADVAPVSDYALFRRYPALAAAIPRLPLAELPTPVESAPSLGRALGLDALYLKRDDVSSARYGGGKVRKLELLLAAAKAGDRREVVTVGGVGSHHALATALFARDERLAATLVLLPQPVTDEARCNLLACAAAGAELVAASRPGAAERLAVERGAFFIPAGGTTPLGNVGFVNAGFELAEQIEAGALPEPEEVYIPLGTVGSAVGLAIGLAAAGLSTRVVGVRASSPGTSSRRALDEQLRATLAFVRERDPTFPELSLDGSVIIEGSYLGGGYGRATEKGRRARDLFEKHTGQRLELTYTAKAFAALVDAAERRRRRGRSGGPVLFWNTHSARAPGCEALAPDALPAAFRGYFRVSRDHR